MPSKYAILGFMPAVIVVLRALAAPIVSVLTLLASTRVLGVPFSDAYTALAITAALLYFILMRVDDSEDWAPLASGWTTTRKTAFAWLSVIGILLLLGYATKVSAIYSRRALFAWFLVTPPLLTATLIILRQWFRYTVLASGNTRSAVIVGVNDMSRKLAESFRERAELGLDIRGFFDDRSPQRLPSTEPVKLLGRLADLPEFAIENQIDTVFIAIPVTHLERTDNLLNDLRNTAVSIYFVPDIFVFDLIQSRTDEIDGIPIVALCETPFHGWGGLAKRVSDIILASLMLLVALPTMAFIALAIKLTSRGSVIFTQRRYGLEGDEILIYKFRTMTVSEDGDTVTQVTKDDERVTPLGRFLRRYSLDELPQLVNVLQGRMSVVGPRPHAVAHNEEYRKIVRGYMVRHKVAPGITGLAQVNGYRGEITGVENMEKRVHYDLEYLRHWSLALDLKILLRTFRVWLNSEKAY